MKLNVMLMLVAALVVAPYVVSAAPTSRGRAGKAKVVEDDDTPDFSKPDLKPTAKPGDKAPAAKPGEKGKPDAAKPAAAKPAAKPAAKAAVTFDPEPPKPDEVAIAKAKKAKKAAYMKFAEAREMAWKCQQPLVVALLPQGDTRSLALEKVLKERAFLKDFVPANCVLLVWRLKPGKIEMPEGQGRRRNGPPPRATTIDARPLKAAETKFLTAFAVTPEMKANASRNNQPEPKFSEMRNYPQILCVNPWGSKLLFRAPRYEADKGKAGFGAWMSQMVDLFRGHQFEPVLTPSLEKIVENPTEPKKWK